MHRFFVLASAVQGGTVILEGQVAYQIVTVLRMTDGDHILVLDNSGWQMETALDRCRASTGHWTGRSPQPGSWRTEDQGELVPGDVEGQPSGVRPPERD